jgi:hypothetical protein
MDPFPFEGLQGCQSYCGIERIDLDDGRVVIVCTELPSNPGTHVRHFAAELATLVCNVCGVDPATVVWIDGYATGPLQGHFDLVTFKKVCHGPNKADPDAAWEFALPQWRAMQPQDWAELGLEQRT